MLAVTCPKPLNVSAVQAPHLARLIQPKRLCNSGHAKTEIMSKIKNVSTKAYVVDSPGAPFVLKDVILDEVQEGEVLVDIKYTGICHTASFGRFMSLFTAN